MVIIAILASVLACVAPSNTSVVGFWESEAVSRGGIGQSMELKANGELLSSTMVTIDQIYRAADGKLFIAESAKALSEAKDGAPFNVTKDLFVQRDDAGDEIRKERLGGQGQAPSPLTGAWKYRHYTGAIAFERYTEDGRFFFRLPMTSQPGCFRATSDSLSIDTAGRTSTMQYTVVGVTLTLRSADGKSYAYRRAEAWYPRDRIDYQPPK